MAQIYTQAELMPTTKDIEKILSAKLSYEAAQQKPDKDTWNKKNFMLTPWGISYTCSKAKYEKSIATAKSKGWDKHNGYKPPVPKTDETLRYFIVAVALEWKELIDQLKRTLKNWGYTTADLQQMATQVWQDQTNMQHIADTIVKAQNGSNIILTEAVEKHDTLNSKLFTKEELLKDRVRDKMLEIVDEFLADLKEQDIKIKVDDILLIGSNASYNYTKDSDIDLHILANTKAVKYEPKIGNALYSAYRSLFNKNLDIKIFDISLELFVETEDSQRVSNGVYSVKKNKWIKKPVHEAIPDYDTKALDKLVTEWEKKCKDLFDDIKADKLENENKVVKMLEDIYDKLRKKGVAKGEYSTENLAFKELRNKGYLDKLKDYRNELTSKRLSLEERLDKQTRIDVYNQISRAAGSPPIIQDNGMFFVYNLKANDVSSAVSRLRKLPFIAEVNSYESGKYDFNDINALMRNNIPSKYYNIRGMIKNQ
jgi:predicted nucleotidyltransferase